MKLIKENLKKSFAILEHSGWGAVHYDFLLEAGGVLATWQFERNPAGVEEGGRRECKKIQDHRLAYLTYEGEVSGGRGEVRRVDQGEYEQIEVGEACWRFRLMGNVMRGEFELRQSAGEGEVDSWVLTRKQ